MCPIIIWVAIMEAKVINKNGLDDNFVFLLTWHIEDNTVKQYASQRLLPRDLLVIYIQMKY